MSAMELAVHARVRQVFYAYLLILGGAHGKIDKVGHPAPAASSNSHGALDFNTVKLAFESRSGLTLRVASVSNRKEAFPSSTTVWRSDLPMSLFTPPHVYRSDTAGIILTPSRINVLCGYPVDANSIVRVSPEDHSKKDVCGIMGREYAFMSVGNMSGPCEFARPEDFASAYFYKPMVSVAGIPAMWALEYNVCHFTNALDTLAAQKALLEAMMHQPEGMTFEESLGNATRLGAGITGFNEVIVAPYEDSSVGGIFWAHPGGLRKPAWTDKGACEIAEHLASTSDTSLPLFELAEVHLDRPFNGCMHRLGELPPKDCLSKNLAEWKRHLTTKVGIDTSSVIRAVSPSVFHEHLASGACGPVGRLEETLFM
eukprot:TRINITY_DN7894_c0_g1_i1.p1 TRINITY_DN7894_c0_g1~~TRINITY_DN7894_c0_g1_i1.p1  ORF type:complete len:370 (-),score=42.20 TRINITY_DN7894_c0_g1_i1:110-1219(-)